MSDERITPLDLKTLFPDVKPLCSTWRDDVDNYFLSLIKPENSKKTLDEIARNAFAHSIKSVKNE